MYIVRDITARLSQSHSPAIVLVGPRQCGKSTLLAKLAEPNIQELTFDDLQLRNLAERDPALFFEQFVPPCMALPIAKLHDYLSQGFNCLGTRSFLVKNS